MAQKVEVTLVDDLDGGRADETVVFGLDGTRYVIDLSDKNAKKLRDALAKYVEVARRDRGTRGAPGRSAATARKSAQGGPNTSEVREWARAQGFEVSERGRVSKDLIVKFQEAH